jgi:hypothetical protein
LGSTTPEDLAALEAMRVGFRNKRQAAANDGGVEPQPQSPSGNAPPDVQPEERRPAQRKGLGIPLLRVQPTALTKPPPAPVPTDPPAPQAIPPQIATDRVTTDQPSPASPARVVTGAPLQPRLTYTPEDFDLAARYIVKPGGARPTANDVRACLLLQERNNFRFATPVGYTRSYPREEAETVWERFIIPWQAVDLTDPETKKKIALPGVLRLVGRVVRERPDLTAVTSYVDTTTDEFVEAIAARRSGLFGRRHDVVDQWLRLLGGDPLLDWLRFVFDLSKPLPGLVLVGLSSAGKTMLARALARYWSTRGWTNFEDVIAKFNAPLLQCPLVVADETLPPLPRGKSWSAKLRDLTQRDCWPVEKKYHDRGNINGHVRFVLPINDLGELVRGNDAISRDALAATANKFTVIQATQEAVDFLKDQGGRFGDPASGKPGTRDWIDDDILVQHLIWISENRVVDHGKRFLVDGNGTAYADRLATEMTLTGLTIAGCVRVAMGATLPHGFIIGEGAFWVSAPAILEQWGDLLGNDDRIRPTLPKLGEALHTIAKRGTLPASLLNRFHGDRDSQRGPKYWSFNVQKLIEWEDAHGSDAELLQSKINGPVVSWSKRPMTALPGGRR